MEKNITKHQTEAQKYNKDFEELSRRIVEILVDRKNTIIKHTEYTKDGGYDIVVEYKENSIIKKAYFECKLRSKNLNLRDVSANIIIAFNEGAVALVIITNYDYTEQTNENLSEFFKNTFLNIKIIAGKDIQKICKTYNISIHDGLSKIIEPKRTKKRNEKYSFLKIDLNKSNYFEQIFRKSCQVKETYFSFIEKVYYSECQKLSKFITNGETVLVTGYLGIGKSTLIKNVVKKKSVRAIQIIADNFMSQSQLLLGIFLDIWGLPTHSIVQEFSNDIIERIKKSINQKSGEDKIGDIVENLLRNKIPDEIADEHYNRFICDYLINQLNLHRSHVSYVFFIENIEYSTKEVQILLAYIVKLFSKYKISCIIERNDSEYLILDKNKSKYFYDQLHLIRTNYLPMRFLEPTEAYDFICEELINYPNSIKNIVLKKGGVRLLTLNILISYVKEVMPTYNSNIDPQSVFDKFSANNLPESILSLISYYYNSFPSLFHYFYILGYKIPLNWVDILGIKKEMIIQKLIDLKFLVIDDNYLLVANQLVAEIIRNLCSNATFIIRQDAKKILDLITDTDDMLYIECKISAYSYLKHYNEATHLITTYMKKLRNERQYSAFIEYGNMILEKSFLEFIPIEHQTNIIISILETWALKKEIHLEKASKLLDRLETIIMYLPRDTKHKFCVILDYFKSKKYFKECDFNLTINITEPYYNNCINANFDISESEYYEKICVVYALAQKELFGNEKAKKVFDKLNKTFSKSFSVRLEYLSHKACMNFYTNPVCSLNSIEQILKMHKREHQRYYELPFHEYVDRAMCAFFVKRYDDALSYSEEAIRILDSNGIIPTLGRAYNIKGCVMICKNNLDEAERFFQEACYAMDESSYKLYSWRSRLNLVYLDIIKGRNHITNVIQMLNDTYLQFKDIYIKKIRHQKRNSSFNTTREYFALLMFGQLFKKLDKSMIDDIMNLFTNEVEKKEYKMNLHQLCDGRVKKVYYRDCPYALDKYLFMVG